MKLNDILTESTNTKGLKIYLVGGAVRDKLMGFNPKDLDYVVVGATPKEMEKRGFKQVGADFPVFLDDKGDEYALARTERKTGAGYKGFDTSFDPSTSLVDDLARRDLTINAMAEDPDTGKIIDPHNGQKDLKNKVLRHVSDAFAEDPLRVLRAARFAARYNFDVAPETQNMMRQLVKGGELSTLSPERVWKEASRAVMEKSPQKFAEVMNDVGALDAVFGDIGPALKDSYHNLRTLSKSNATEIQRWMGVALKANSQTIDSFIKKSKVPNDVASAMRLVKKIEATDLNSAEAVLNLLNQTRAWNNLTLFEEFAAMIKIIKPAIKFDKVLTAARDAAKVSFDNLDDEEKASLKGPDIGKAIAHQREKIIRSHL